jgi:peptide/nickel transport system substrate-binding protein
MAVGIDFPATADGIRSGYSLVRYGAAETLTRLTPQNGLEPWLAARVTNVDPTTWRVALRPNVTFWDGTPLTADAVIAAFKANWDGQPGAATVLDKTTQIVAVDSLTLDFKLPKPASNFPNVLTSQFLVIHKANGTIMTGPYRPTKLDVDHEVVLEAFPGYWAGTPALVRISVKLVPDPNTRVLALQAGDVDLLYGLPPENFKDFGGAFATQAIPSTRIHSLGLNGTRPPFSDRALREATAWGIDRQALLKIGLDGQGAVATGMLPAISGLDIVPLQTTDVGRAKALLDGAGWLPGADGVRSKDGKRLAFTLLTYPGRAELTPIAVTMQGQLKPLGYDIQIQQVQNIKDGTKDANFDAAMGSTNALVTGDVLTYYTQTLTRDGTNNYSRYVIPSVPPLIDQLRAETDPTRQQTLSHQIQELVKSEVPYVFLVVPPVTVATKKGAVNGLVLHPNDIYLITGAVSLA